MSLLQQVQLLQRHRAAKRKRDLAAVSDAAALRSKALQPHQHSSSTQVNVSLSACEGVQSLSHKAPDQSSQVGPGCQGVTVSSPGTQCAFDVDHLSSSSSCPVDLPKAENASWTDRSSSNTAFAAEVAALSQPAESYPHQPVEQKWQSAKISAFYGDSAARLTAVEFRIQRFLSGVRRRLKGSEVPLKTFPLQAPAFEYADSHPGDQPARVFSCETSSTSGARNYIVAPSYERFWRHYNRIADSRRHHYEIIREGSPCHLYFDLEFNAATNSEVDGDALTDRLLAAVSVAAHAKFDIAPIATSAEAITELDSSTAAKFSRHLVVRLPGVAFASTRDVGAFVAALLAESGDAFVVCKGGEGGTTSFVDSSVYSRNRAFRLYLSSKAGKSAVLQPSGRLPGSDGTTQRDIFMRALICNVPPDLRLLRCAPPATEPAGSLGTWTASTAIPSQSQLAGQSRPLPSTHPAVDQFLATIQAPDGTRGEVRSWAAMGADVLLMSMRGSRWCGNVGRHHRSNGIYYVVDLAAGTWWQKCFDTDCRHYRSEMMPLPPHLLPPASAATTTPGVTLALRGGEGVLAGNTMDSEGEDDAAALAAAAEAEEDHLCLLALQDFERAENSVHAVVT